MHKYLNIVKLLQAFLPPSQASKRIMEQQLLRSWKKIVLLRTQPMRLLRQKALKNLHYPTIYEKLRVFTFWKKSFVSAFILPENFNYLKVIMIKLAKQTYPVISSRINLLNIPSQSFGKKSNHHAENGGKYTNGNHKQQHLQWWSVTTEETSRSILLAELLKAVKGWVIPGVQECMGPYCGGQQPRSAEGGAP